ncbi:toprim domain-containing protein [Bradyrhizobium erythrophlei]|uniref:Twinkle protein n=1 Tax=Bradyrhizobium erythrophlei TaxID=1437360 RepID=A0A1M5TA94_9BRAD|nr:toprim domain-containing protein [Bradyrhizobium erythrophlei]SHH47705.1 twinkle protein [Bradyrhizobium erythrophlei]
MTQTNSKLIQSGLPCPSPFCDSSDAFSTYDDGHGFCFSCGTYAKPGSPGTPAENDLQSPKAKPITISSAATSADKFTHEYLPWRGLSADTCRFYKALARIAPDGKPIAIGFPYPVGVKVRGWEEKRFHSEGDFKGPGLFGMDKFNAGQSMSITITEGETDAMSVFQMLGSKYPAVSVRSATSAKTDCAAHRDYLNSFDKIYLCFDNDVHGKKAAKEVASLFDFNKVYDVNLTKHKDANEYLSSGQSQDFKNIWFNAKRFLPEGIVSSWSEFGDILDAHKDKKSYPIPFAQLNEMNEGLRTGEVFLVTAMEGIGKTEFVRSLEYELLLHTNENIGTIHLEESKARQLKALAGLYLEAPVHKKDSSIATEDIIAAVKTVTRRDERLHMYSHFGSDDPTIILDTIRFLVTACDCKFVILDHITLVVTGLAGDDERKTLDMLSTRLAMMVEELDFCLILVSHINDDGKTRGSRNISKIAHTWLQLSRDVENESEDIRNVTTLLIKKARFTGETGPAGRLRFDKSKFKLEEDSGPVFQPVSLPT